MDDRTASLLGRAQKGDLEAFAALFEQLRPALFGVAYRLVGPDEVEDVVMETFLKAWQALPRFRRGSSLKTWVYRIAHNCSVDTLRRRERRKETQLGDDEADRDAWERIPDTRAPGPDEAALKREDIESVQAALRELTEEHRTALLLRFSDGLSCEEIAAATGVSVGTVLSRLFYGKRKLRKILDAHRAGV